jgi:hypothetical protein
MTRVKNIKALLETRAWFRAHPTETAIVPIPGDFPERWSKADFDAWFWDCLCAKIHRDDKRNYRAMDRGYLIKLRRDHRAIQDKLQRRIRVYQFETEICRKKFSNLLSSYSED